MEEAQVEEKVSLEDKFAEFELQIKDLRQKPAGLESQLSDLQGKLSRLKAGRAANLAQDEMKKAETLAVEIKKLEPEIEVIEAKLQALGPGGKESVQALIQNSPGSKLFELAQSIVEEVAEIAPGLEEKLQYFCSWGIAEEKEKYLKIIEDFSEKLSVLYDILRAGLLCQQFLPAEFRKCKKLRLISPAQNQFEIDVMEIGQIYKPLSRTSLPD